MSKRHKNSQNMSFLNSIFGNSDPAETPKKTINWIPLTNLIQLDEIAALSAVKPIVIFKHSTRCSISRMALKQFEKDYDLEENAVAYFLDLIEYREVSNEIANRFNVYHESPQLILIKDGKATYDASHSDIDATVLKSKL